MNLLLLLLLGTLWGSSYLFIKIAVAEIPPFTLVTGRLLLSAIMLWILLRLLGRSMPRGKSIWGTYAVMGFFSGTLPYVLITWGEQYIPSSLAALLQATMPIFTVILAFLIAGDEPMTWRRVLGVLVGFGGVGILLLPDLRQGLQENLLGQLAVVGSSLSYAASAIFARKRLHGQSPMASAAGQVTTGALFTLPFSLLVDQPFDLAPSLSALGAWLGLILLGTVFAYIIYYELLERTSATYVSTVTYIIPINGLILGFLILSEPLTATLLGSSALIMLGVLLVRS
jgi:drug/metabolite transporter (DMT)-like permease